ncbi:type II toxin-antitoxin system VapC family toxin [Agitococcus lubricus]|uniref:PIN domain-containing protein n=1 Tax=Agitococcus lubricus TaxID=1077255 RepID=A0A2T5J3Y8_9GAMM|nr:type II toxin-antitoxin system VapC family toxin [Agitococcus lubricus]PTQ91312.1 hypothetical protein C8N29_101385 [Agitococcus lubricus]
MLLLDIHVISELRKVNTGKADIHFAHWSKQLIISQLYISSITIMELEIGILQKSRHDIQQGKMLRHWFEQQVLPSFNGRIIAIDTSIALACARLHIPDQRAERDALIAATALTLVTRNVKDFVATGVVMINPWEG